jgi:hypothetical protein
MQHSDSKLGRHKLGTQPARAASQPACLGLGFGLVWSGLIW